MGQKRKREAAEELEAAGALESVDGQEDGAQPVVKKVKKQGPKAPNPLSIKKAKKKDSHSDDSAVTKSKLPDRIERQIKAAREQMASQDTEGTADGSTKKRRKKTKSIAEGGPKGETLASD